MRPLGSKYKDAEASTGGFEKLPAGGYVCKITEARDCPVGFDPQRPDKGDYIAVVFDIAEGPFKGYYDDDFGKEHKSAHTYYASYRDDNFNRFKGFLKAIDESNSGTTFAEQAINGLKEQQLVGKLVGILMGEEEYNSNYGDVRVNVKARNVCSAERIRKGDFQVPKLRKLKEAPAAPAIPSGFTAMTDDDLPF